MRLSILSVSLAKKAAGFHEVPLKSPVYGRCSGLASKRGGRVGGRGRRGGWGNRGAALSGGGVFGNTIVASCDVRFAPRRGGFGACEMYEFVGEGLGVLWPFRAYECLAWCCEGAPDMECA